MTWLQIVLAIFVLVASGWIVIPLGILKLVTPERWWRRPRPTPRWLEQAEREMFASSPREAPTAAPGGDRENGADV